MVTETTSPGSQDNSPGFKQALKRRTLSTDVDNILYTPPPDEPDINMTRRPLRSALAEHPISELDQTNCRQNRPFEKYFTPLVSIKSHYDLPSIHQLRKAPFRCTGVYFKVLVVMLVLVLSTFVMAIFLEPLQHEGFIRISGQKFELDCRPFYLIGFNTHDLMEGALVTPSHFRTQGGLSGRQLIKNMFQDASSAGLNTLRTWAHTNDAKFPFQISPGAYDESAFQSLDYILEEARRNGMKVILSFVDNWKYYNGVAQYVDWSKTAPVRNQSRPVDQFGDPNPVTFAHENEKIYETARQILFFTDTDCKLFYQSHIVAILNRINKFNGRKYKDDPTIMAWDLLNEPRCEKWMIPQCPDILQQWLVEMANFVRNQDPNHLITIGSEGFYGANSEHTLHNPQDWAADMGQDFVSNNLVKNVDFATIHVWPNNWNRTSTSFQKQWIQSHTKVTNQEIKKPLLLEEFGKKLIEKEEQSAEGVSQLRDPVYRLTYELVEKGIMSKMGMGGSLFWRWHMPKFAGEGTGEYGVQPEDTTFPIIKQHANFINTVINSVPPNPQCNLECWVAEVQLWGLVRKCVHDNKACSDYWNQPNAQKKQQQRLYYTSKRACCRVGSGAFGDLGCSWTSLIM